MQKIKKLLKLCRAYFPSKLPTSGMSEFDEYCDSILSLYSIPDNKTTRQMLTTFIFQQKPEAGIYYSKRLFGRIVLKTITNELCYQKLQDLKRQEKQEVTPPMSESNGEEAKGTAGPVVPEAQG